MTADELRKFGVDALLACCAAVGRPPAAVLRVAEVGQTDPDFGHAAFDGVRNLTLAEHAKWWPASRASGLLEVAEAAARVIYNSTTPEDPFDADSEELLFAAISGFCRSLPFDRRELLSAQLARALTPARLSASTKELSDIRRDKLVARWYVGDPEASRVLAGEMTADQLRIFSVDALAACCTVVGGTPSAVLRVVDVGREAPRLSRVAYDAVEELRVAVEAGSQPVSPPVRLLRVAAGAAQVIYNSTTPDDPFDARSGEWFFQTLAGLCQAIDADRRKLLSKQLLDAFTSARLSAAPTTA